MVEPLVTSGQPTELNQEPLIQLVEEDAPPPYPNTNSVNSVNSTSPPPPYIMTPSRRRNTRDSDLYLSEKQWGAPTLEEAELYFSTRSSKPRRYRDKDSKSDHSSETDSDDFDDEEHVRDPERAARIKKPKQKSKMVQWVFTGLLGLAFFAWMTRSYWHTPSGGLGQVAVEPVNPVQSAIAEEADIEASIDAVNLKALGAHMAPSFSDLTLLADLPSKKLPSSPGDRLVVVGDIHGMLGSLDDLLSKLNFDKKRDHLIAAGDFISKGPDSKGLVSRLMEVGATCVRGNHEDRVLIAGAKTHQVGLIPPEILASQTKSEGASSEEMEAKLADLETFSHSGEYKDRLLAKSFTHKQNAWLQECPVILRIGHLPGVGEVAVVHGGLVPGLKLERQDPWMCMNMRSIHLPTFIPSDGRGRGNGGDKIKPGKGKKGKGKGISREKDLHLGKSVDWFKVWNRFQLRLLARSEDQEDPNNSAEATINTDTQEEGETNDNAQERVELGITKNNWMKPTTVIYGHDSKLGLQITEYTRGIDTACLKGGRLTAVVFEMKENGKMKESLVSVKCHDGRQK